MGAALPYTKFYRRKQGVRYGELQAKINQIEAACEIRR